MSDGRIIIGTAIDTKEFDSQIRYIEDRMLDIEDKLKQADMGFEVGDTNKLEAEYERLGNQLLNLKERQKKYNESLKEAGKADLSGIKLHLNDIGNSIERITKKVVHWGLAVFGIRGAYMAIRRAVTIVSADNEKVANSFEQIRHVIASALLPVVQTVVNAIVKLMVYINYIWKVLTGKNLFNFADATKKSADSLKSGAGSSGKIAKNLKDARKQLAGFDEMNILSDNTTAAGGSGGAGGSAATDFANIFDKWKKIKIPKWIQTLAKILKSIKDNWKELLPIVGAFAGLLLALKIAPFIHALTGATTALSLFKVGLGLAVAGAVLLIGEIINMIFNWDKMTTKQKVLSVALAALGAAFIALGYAIATGISVATLGIGLVIAAVVALIATITGFIIKMAKEEKAIKSVKKATDDLREAKEKLKDAEDEYINAVDNAKEKQKALKEIQDKTGKSGEELYKKVQNGTIDYKNLTDSQKELYKAYRDNIEAQKKVKSTSNELKKAKDEVKMKTWEQKLAVDAEAGAYEEYKKKVVKAYNEGKLSASEAAELISKAMTDMSKDSEQTFTKDIPKDVKEGIDPDKYRTTWQKFKSDWKKNLLKLGAKITLKLVLGPVDGILRSIDSLLDKIQFKINTKKGKISGAASGIGGKIKRNAKGAVVYPGKLPRLAIGGVINQPGRGVPLAGAIGGEGGPEGVIPLTDSQQMALLGEAIGRYITVNAVITNKMNGRVISREIQKVQNDSDFAYNR